MKINAIDKKVFLKKSSDIACNREIYRPYFVENKDCFEHQNLNVFNYQLDEKTHKLKQVNFKHPLHVSDALDSIVKSNNYSLQEKFLKVFHPISELKEFSSDLKNISELSCYKVKSLFGLGSFALVFETEDNKVLKITGFNHYPNNRKPDFFDLPIFKHGVSGNTHYYIEEKVSQDNLPQGELRALVKAIKDKGYRLSDYLLHYDDSDKELTIRTCQFGRAKNGKIYLIDPGCAIAPPKSFFDLKRLKNLLSRKFKF